MKAPTRSVWGSVILGILVLACSLGPLLLPDTGDGDPLHASLLPPLSRVTLLELTDGRTLMSSDVTVDGSMYRVRGPRSTSSIPSDEVAAEGDVRLWLGSDRFGRDVLRRLLEGGRISLVVAALGVSFALLIGLGVGLAAATGGRIADTVLMRSVDALLAFPILLLLILLSALFRPGPVLLMPFPIYRHHIRTYPSRAFLCARHKVHQGKYCFSRPARHVLSSWYPRLSIQRYRLNIRHSAEQ